MSDATSLSRGLAGSWPAARPNLRRTVGDVPLAELGAPLAQFPGARLSIYRSIPESEPAWRAAVASGVCYAFQCFDWQAAFQDSIGAAEGVVPVIAHVADRDGHSLLLLPLGIQREGRLRVLGFLGGIVTNYGAPIVAPGLAHRLGSGEIDKLLGAILRYVPSVDLVRLRRMPETIEGERNPLVSLRRAQPVENSYALLLPQSPDQLKRSASDRRQRRLLAKHGSVAFRTLTTASPEADAAMAVLQSQKSRRWRETCCPDLFAEPAYVAFYDRVAHGPLQEVEAYISALTVGGEIAAAHCGILFRNRFYALLISRDDGELSRHSPGRLLLEDLALWCAGQGDVRVLDLGPGDQAYKHKHSDHTLPLYEYLAPRSLKGAAFLAQRALRPWLKRHRGLRNWVRRRNGLPPV